MFTGIIETLGRIRRAERGSGGMRLAVEIDLAADEEPLRLGESAALNGACLTAASVQSAEPGGSQEWEADLSLETLRRTALGGLRVGGEAHVERALAAGDRLSGHFVQGHVDETGVVRRLAPEGGGMLLDVGVSEGGMRYLAEKGSVAVDGVSLTAAQLLPNGFRVALIPHTLARTTLGGLRRGDRVNIEFDILAKYAERAALYANRGGGADRELLEKRGYMDGRPYGRPGR